jgi:purine nucleosidase
MRAETYDRGAKRAAACLVLVVVAAVLLGNTGIASAARGADRLEPPPVIFDNDVDFDDTASLAHLARLHKAGRIDLRLVSVTSAGAGLPGHAIRNVRCLLERFGITDVPVADSRAVGPNPFPDQLRFGIDALLADVLAGCTASEDPSPIPAERAIVDVLKSSRQPVTLIATGPFTNVAGALRLQPGQDDRSLVTRISRAYLMGGGLKVSDGLCCGLDATFDYSQTFNMWGDPAAAQAVLDELRRAQVSLVAHDATQHVPIRLDYIARLVAEEESSRVGDRLPCLITRRPPPAGNRFRQVPPFGTSPRLARVPRGAVR